ncbi:MAG TPA: hypothetical protein VK179_20670 [Bacteroidales bacterium]|nr:hypothetical protein [Bacteroidales bacterium]
MKTTVCLILFSILLCIPLVSKADVIYTPYRTFGTFISFEGIASYEYSLSPHHTVDFWSGAGLVASTGDLWHPAAGAEAAIEFRHYFAKNSFKNFNLGLYLGMAYMKLPDYYEEWPYSDKYSFGVVPGLKFSYKHRFNSWLVAEPYAGISLPIYTSKNPEIDLLNVYLTFGVRIGLNKVK